MKRAALLCLVWLCVPIALTAQETEAQGTDASPGVVAHHVQPVESVTEVQSPMQLEIPLGATAKRKSLLEHDKVPLISNETEAFTCDKARVRIVQVWHKKRRGGMAEVKIIPTIATDYYRQDIDLTVALVSDGKVVREKSWQDFTIGRDSAAGAFWVAMASHTKSPEAAFDIPEKELAAMFDGGKAPVARIVITIK